VTDTLLADWHDVNRRLLNELANADESHPSAQEPASAAISGGRVTPSLGAFFGWVVVATTIGVGLAGTDPLVDSSAVAHLALAVARLVGFGAIAALVVGAFGRWAPAGRWIARIGAFAGASGVASVLIADDLSNFAGRVAHVLPTSATFAIASTCIGAGVLACIEVGRALRRTSGRLLATGLAIAVAAHERDVLAGQYPALHLFAIVFAATLLGSALTAAPLRHGVVAHRVARAAAIVSLVILFVPLENDMRYRLARDGDVLAPFLVTASSTMEAAPQRPAAGDWLTSRAGLPDVPPTSGARFASAPVVLLITIDCLRYDLLGDARARLPNLDRLASEGLSFERAYAPGSSTVYSLSAIFSGKHYSLLEWSGERRASIFPRNDETPRIPELLDRGGVHTVQAASMNWLDDTLGITRGFRVRDYEALPGPRWKPGTSVTDALVARLGEIGDDPTFLYAHFIDAHEPYAGPRATPAFERYAREVELVDSHVGRLLEAIDRHRLRDRTVVIITADHGEGFGEHRRRAHGNSLYDELIRVPLLIRSPGTRARTIETPVTLVDLGPTILDVFRRPTPSYFMGESLYPLLRDEDIAPTRPIIAQVGRLRAHVTQDLLKVIRDLQRQTIEAYELRSDPRELSNIADDEREDVRKAIGELDAYFEIHQFRRAGYVEPYRAL
jgi:hypothetical protein